MSPATRGRLVTKKPRTTRLSASATAVPEVSLPRVTRSQTAGRSTDRNEAMQSTPTARQTSTARRGGRIASQAGTRQVNNPIPEIAQPSVSEQTPNREQENETVPVTPEEASEEVAIVDLVTPAPSLPRIRTAGGRPLEVDLTCELDDEVFVVLEDIVNPSRRSTTGNALPVLLGGSPSRVRIGAPRRLVVPYRRTCYPIGHFHSTLGYPTVPPLEPIPGNLNNPQRQEPSLSLPSTNDELEGVQPTTSTGEQKESKDGIQCPICLDTLSQIKIAGKKIYSTICGHLFCGHCITKSLVNSKECPTCRQKLTSSQVHPIFI